MAVELTVTDTGAPVAEVVVSELVSADSPLARHRADVLVSLAPGAA